LNEKQISKLDKYINEINNDQTLKHKIEKINLLLTNSSLNQSNGSISFLNDSLNNNNNNEAAINPLDIDHEDDDSNLNDLARSHTCTIQDVADQTIIKTEDELLNADIGIMNAKNCIIKLFGNPSVVHINNIENKFL
jgi:hypothetical protein